jgi:hypothetical protein
MARPEQGERLPPAGLHLPISQPDNQRTGPKESGHDLTS